MHEMAIAEMVLGIACGSAGERKVETVQLRVGRLRQVVPSALTFAFELAAQGTVAEGARLEIEDVPAMGHCRSCGARDELTDFPFACRSCGGVDLEMESGEELVVDSLEVVDEPVLVRGGATGG